MNTSTNTGNDDGFMSPETWRQLKSAWQQTMRRYDALDRLSERLRSNPTIRYVSNEYIPGGPDDGVSYFWWEERDVLLIAAARVEMIKQEMVQLGVTLIPVDDEWHQEQARMRLFKPIQLDMYHE